MATKDTNNVERIKINSKQCGSMSLTGISSVPWVGVAAKGGYYMINRQSHFFKNKCICNSQNYTLCNYLTTTSTITLEFHQISVNSYLCLVSAKLNEQE